MKNNSVIFFVDVETKYLNQWEYYLVDKEILEKLYEKVLISNNTIEGIYYLFKNPKADIFCWWWHKSSFVIFISKILGRRTFCTGAIHMYDYSKGITFYNRSLLYRLLVKSTLRICDYNLFISNDQYLSITSSLQVNNPIVLLSSLTNNRSLNKPSELEICNNFNTKECNLLFLGWLNKEGIYRKSLLKTLEALSICIHERGKIMFLSIVGKPGDGVEIIKKFVEKYNLKRFVKFAFDVSQEEKNLYYIKSDLLVSPSYMEGFGNASLEAMSFGCPALVSKYGASSEVVGDSGYIINSIDKYSIADTLCIYEGLSVEEKKKMRIKSYNRAYNNFGFDQRLTRMRNLILDRN